MEMKNGWWSIHLELEGNTVRPSDLSDTTLEHIANCVKEGYHSGEILEESQEEEV